MKKNAGYDLVSASGDASNRLIASGLVQPIDPKTIPNWNQLTPQLVKGPNHFVGRQVLRAALAVGPERADVEHRQVQGRDLLLVGALRPQEQGQDHDPEQPDPDRRRGALPVEDEARARDQGSVRAQLRPAARRGRAAQAAAAADQGLLGLRDRRGQDLPDRRSHARARPGRSRSRSSRARA